MTQRSDLVDRLLAQTGVYVGLGQGITEDEAYVARIVLTPLPGLCGVAIDFEANSSFRMRNDDTYFEHAMLGRTRDDETMLVAAHSPSGRLAVMTEREPGRFAGEGRPLVGVRIEVPEPGQLVYAWSWELPGEEIRERDVATVKLTQLKPGR